jgi:hypothetical protein
VNVRTIFAAAVAAIFLPPLVAAVLLPQIIHTAWSPSGFTFALSCAGAIPLFVLWAIIALIRGHHPRSVSSAVWFSIVLMEVVNIGSVVSTEKSIARLEPGFSTAGCNVIAAPMFVAAVGGLGYAVGLVVSRFKVRSQNDRGA